MKNRLQHDADTRAYLAACTEVSLNGGTSRPIAEQARLITAAWERNKRGGGGGIYAMGNADTEAHVARMLGNQTAATKAAAPATVAGYAPVAKPNAEDEARARAQLTPEERHVAWLMGTTAVAMLKSRSQVR